MRHKTFFVTDAHLGSGTDSRQREAELVKWLDSIEDEANLVRFKLYKSLDEAE